MKWLTLAGLVQCTHTGTVALAAVQSWVRVDGSPVLLFPDPAGKPISSPPCPVPPLTGTKPCTLTFPLQKGFSSWIFIGGLAVCREDAKGKTDGMPAGLPSYVVRRPGQSFVEETP